MSGKATCPICDDPVETLDDNPSFPFCSSRCKRRDLGLWFDESYAISMTPETTDRRLDPDSASRGDDEES